MPLPKPDASFGRRYLVNYVAFGGPFVVTCLVGLVAFQRRWIEWSIGIWVVGLVIALVGVVRQQSIMTRYLCPQCRAVLPRVPMSEEGDKGIRFHCPDCDIIWETGFREGD
jgi:DNA-directed RNA polymerase subunit RPC12/RpoP